MDVFIEVVSVLHAYPDGSQKLRVKWWNKGQMGEPFEIGRRPGEKQTIKIKGAHMKHWSRIFPFKEKERAHEPL